MLLLSLASSLSLLSPLLLLWDQFSRLCLWHCLVSLLLLRWYFSLLLLWYSGPLSTSLLLSDPIGLRLSWVSGCSGWLGEGFARRWRLKAVKRKNLKDRIPLLPLNTWWWSDMWCAATIWDVFGLERHFEDWLSNFDFNVTVTILFVVVNLISLVKITGFTRFCFFSLFIDTFQNFCFQRLTTLALNMGSSDQAEVKEEEQKCEEGVKLGQEAGFISPCFIPAASSGPCFICSTPDSPLCPDCEKVPTNYHFSTFLESHHHHSQCQFDQHYNGHWVRRILLISRLCFTHAIQVKLQNRNPPTKSCFVKWKKLWS